MPTLPKRREVRSLEFIILIILIGSLGIGCLIGFFIRMKIIERRISQSKLKGTEILDESKKEANNIIKEARIQQKDELYRSRAVYLSGYRFF